jgi:hypothetical protein
MKFWSKVLGIVIVLMLSACQKAHVQVTQAPAVLPTLQASKLVILPTAVDNEMSVLNKAYLDGYNAGYGDRFHGGFAYDPLLNDDSFNRGYVRGYKDATHAFTEVQLMKQYPHWVMFNEMQSGDNYRLFDGLKHDSITFISDDGQRFSLSDGTPVIFLKYEKLGYLIGKLHVRWNNINGWVSLDQVLGGLPDK